MCKKVLVLVLNSGENEFQKSIASLQHQTYKNWRKIVFSNLSNKIAHDTLYNYIMNHHNEYDLFMKLDADMVMTNDYVLENIVNYFEKNPNVDQGNFAVYDKMSNQNMMGLLVFTGKAIWKGGEEDLFVDYTPVTPGKRLLIWGKPSPVATHCPNPHLFQAFHYGVHRAMKAIQKNRKRKNFIQSAIQWHLLYRVWKIFMKEKDIERGMMMLGAYSVWNGDVDNRANEYCNPSLRRSFKNYHNNRSDEMLSFLLTYWKRIIVLHNWLYILLWPKLSIYKIRCRLVTKLNCGFCLLRRSYKSL